MPGFRSHRNIESLPLDGVLAVPCRVPLLQVFTGDISGRSTLTPEHRQGFLPEVRESISGCTGGDTEGKLAEKPH